MGVALRLLLLLLMAIFTQSFTGMTSRGLLSIQRTVRRAATTATSSARPREANLAYTLAEAREGARDIWFYRDISSARHGAEEFRVVKDVAQGSTPRLRNLPLPIPVQRGAFVRDFPAPDAIREGIGPSRPRENTGLTFPFHGRAGRV